MKRLALALPTISPLGGGVSEVARLHVSALSRAGFDAITVHALSPSTEKVMPGQWQGAEMHLHKSIGPKSYSLAPALLWSLFAAKPDLVHVHGVWQFQCLAVHFWSLVTGKPYVVTPHGMLEPWIRARSKTLKGLVSALYQNSFLKRASAFHLLTDKEAEDVAEFATGQPAEIIRNFVEPFSHDGARPGWWQETMEGKRIWLFFGRIHVKKGCMELIDAWDRLSARDPSFKDNNMLVFCGWNDGIEGFEAAVQSLSRKHGNALFAGPQYGPDKNRSLAAADLFVLPSKSEGLPVAVLEAWAAGKPVLMTPECNLPIGFERGAAFPTGFTVETIEPALASVAALPDAAWGEAGIRAKALADEEFSADRVRTALLALYDAATRYKATRR